ncbi:MAG: hypothetical protein KC418_00760 [Anaerolineales bacterium]|nr:hypothetical protein [Anaerolineales bacterium]
MPKHEAFSRMLSQAIYIIKTLENKNLSVVQDELGYALQRKGGSAVERWRKGYLPPTIDDIETLARLLIQRSQGHLSGEWLNAFLVAAEYPYPDQLSEKILVMPASSPPQNHSTRPGSRIERPLATQSVAGRRALSENHSPVPANRQPPAASTLAMSPAAFIAGPPILRPRDFFGREWELKQIFHRLQGGMLQHVAVMGARRSGKTSLLHYLRQITTASTPSLRPDQRQDWLPHPQHYRWVFVDFQDSRMLRQSTFLGYLMDQLEIPRPEPCELNTFMEAVSENLHMPAILLLDKIEAALASPELDMPFWWNLRSLVTNQTGGNLGIVVTSHKQPVELAQDYGKPSPFFNIFGYAINLGPLRETEARALIASSPVPFAAEDTAWILEQSKGWPALLQILCAIRLIALETGQHDQLWREDGLRQIKHHRHLLEMPA